MLASDHESASLDAVRISIAGDLVELMVLTGDDAFLATLREALGPTRRLWHVPSTDKASDLLLTGGVGILIIDASVLHEAPAVFVSQIKRQFPDLVILVAGHRDAETALATLISGGAVYRFIHKPLSPARARLFADAAIKKYDEQRRQPAEPPPAPSKPRSHRTFWVAAAVAGAAAAAAAVWFAQGGPSRAPSQGSASAEDDARARLLTRAAAALAANRLTEPADDNALDLYRRAQVQGPADPEVRAGMSEVRERLIARAENALLEEHLDEAAAAIETARDAGIENGRLAFLTAQLAKARDEARAAASKAEARAARSAAPDARAPQAAESANAAAEPRASSGESKTTADRMASLLTQEGDRVAEGHLIDPPGDNALYYVQEALRLDPKNDSAGEAEKALALHLLTEAHVAIDRRDFARASAWLDAAQTVAAAANVDAARRELEAARRQADSDARAALLRNARDRLAGDRLIDPEADSAKYYLLTLRSLAPDEPGLAPALQDLGARLLTKARRSLALQQYDAARTWLDEAASVGYGGTEAEALRRDLDAAAAVEAFAANVVAAGSLHLVKSVKPGYPRNAELQKIEGWVELDFTVTEQGTVTDIAVHGTSHPGVFDSAAVGALRQWLYQPVMRDSKPVAQRARIRIRFTLAG